MKNILSKLFQHQPLTRQEARDVLSDIALGTCNESQIAAFMTVYLMRAITVEELQGFREALLALCLPFDMGGEPSIDLCGTGGDAKNTFNISTLASFVVAGAGYKVTKHGNYGVSSICGSSNVLEFLGYQFSNDSNLLHKQLEKANICFMHAPLFHPAMKAVAPVRKQLGIKTFFNMLGPMVNPAKPTHQLTGVFSAELLRLYQYIYQNNTQQYSLVHSCDGYDEVSLTADFVIKTNSSDKVCDARDFGLKNVQESDLYGGESVADAAKIFLQILDNNGTAPQEQVVCANAALAIQCFQPAESLTSCYAIAKESLTSGKAKMSFQRLIAN